MRQRRQILNFIILCSGIIHLSGLTTNWEYDFIIGSIMTSVTIVWFVIDFFKNGRNFSDKNVTSFQTNKFNWRIIVQLPIFFTLLYFYWDSNEELPDSILLTLIIYFTLFIGFNLKKSIEISNKYINDNGLKIMFDSISVIDFRDDKIVLIRTEDYLGNISIELSDFDSESKEQLLERLSTRP